MLTNGPDSSKAVGVFTEPVGKDAWCHAAFTAWHRSGFSGAVGGIRTLQEL